MVREHGSLTKDDETNQAAWEAVKGGAYGGVKWGAFFAVAGGVAYAVSPLYRGLTVQFKTYIQMSAMIFGGMVEADARMLRYHHAVRSHKKLQSDMAVWRAYENEYEERGTPAVGSESGARGKSAGE
ncbi:uncharacterized protein M421DRAFT_415939 [Didymella exigua CBS 183.55]|uniref:Imidazoleglycerol-phosphate dehydratase n=1 Tax=Didymella exigua CBS 183.55 TaxID=1150837 RepID=A0A6A5S1X4_9PLEO|nr:uncharacterized protein M421DRAFT_415939 [Didymella exigua CBS 183.55]KAF1933600.1 hypothetical protein M421DRAFT_415939 [Didymella exigua CBS 183.55]